MGNAQPCPGYAQLCLGNEQLCSGIAKLCLRIASPDGKIPRIQGGKHVSYALFAFFLSNFTFPGQAVTKRVTRRSSTLAKFLLLQIPDVPHRHITPSNLTYRTHQACRKVAHMPTGPKETEARMNKMLNAWEELAHEKSFAGTTLDQFRAIVTRALTARARILDLEAQMLQAVSEREAADEAFNKKAQQVVNGVLAEANANPASPGKEVRAAPRHPSSLRATVTRTTPW